MGRKIEWYRLIFIYQMRGLLGLDETNLPAPLQALFLGRRNEDGQEQFRAVFCHRLQRCEVAQRVLIAFAEADGHVLSSTGGDGAVFEECTQRPATPNFSVYSASPAPRLLAQHVA